VASRSRLLVAWVAVAVVAAGALSATGCGKKGPPLPPLRILPGPARDVQLRQVGTDVVLSAVLPQTTTDGSPLGEGMTVRVLRMKGTETLGVGSVSRRYLQRQFEKDAKVIAELKGADLKHVVWGGHLHFRDRDAYQAGRSPRPLRYLYALVIVDAEGRRSALSPPVQIEPHEPPPPPAALKATTAEGEIRLTWEPGGPPPKEPLFNVYRREAASPTLDEIPLNHSPITEPAYVDGSFRYGQTYRFAVRMVAGQVPPLRESTDSPEVEVTPVDVYPPQAPSGLAVAVEGGVIKLYWFPNSEPDLDAYRIYRRKSGEEEFALLGEARADEASFVDATASPGVRYDYVVTALDSSERHNESPRSEAQSETLPPKSGEPVPARPKGEG
jgi:fibronectin type 3 domain-containing protein